MATALMNAVAQNKLALAIYDTTIRRYITWGLLNKGAERDGLAGLNYDWVVRTDPHIAAAYSAGDSVAYSPKQMGTKASLPFRERIVTQLLYDTERSVLKEPQAVEAYVRRAMELLAKDLAFDLNEQLLQNDGTANNGIHGFPSWNSVTWDNTFGDEAAATGTPNDTYAGLSTSPTAYGGAAATDRRHGVWSPQTATAGFSGYDGTNDAWNEGRNAFATLELLQTAIFGRGATGKLYALLNENDFNILKRVLFDAVGRFDFAVKDGDLAKLGFGNQFEMGSSLTVTFDKAVPASIGYVIDPAAFCLWAPNGNIIQTREDRIPQEKADGLMASFIGNVVVKELPRVGIARTA